MAQKKSKRASATSKSPQFGGPLAKITSIEGKELEVGHAFHAFRFKSGGTVSEALSELKTIEKGELQVGVSFHAFRFNSGTLRELTMVEREELSVGNAFHAFRFH